MPLFQHPSLPRSVALAVLSGAVLAACGGGTSGTDTSTAAGLVASDTTATALDSGMLATIASSRRPWKRATTTSTEPTSTTSTTTVAYTTTTAPTTTVASTTTTAPTTTVASTTTTAPTTTVASTTTTAPSTAVASTTTTVTPPVGVAWTGVSASMWAEINAQRSAFGDANDCQARVNAIPTSGGVTLSPGADINAALASNSVVFLSGGTYKPTSRVTVPAGKKLIGVAGQAVTIDASGVDFGALVQNNAVLANVIIESANGDGVNFYHGPTDTGSTGALVYQVSARRSGYYNATGDGSSGIRLTQNAAHNCIVSSEAFDTWNVLGAPNDHGGNSDGVDASFGANNNTFIDVHAYRNGDDGFDMWSGGASFWYFSDSHDNGKTTGKTLTGDGNGIKLGIGSVAHKFYKTTANNNKSHGFNLNANTMQPVLAQSSASGNGDTDYGNGVNPP